MKPFKHQAEELERTRNLPVWARFWDQGTGKSKTTIDEAVSQYERGEIDGLLVVAPGGVDLNWVTDELPKHLPEAVYARSTIARYRTKSAQTQWHQRMIRQVVAAPKLAVLAMSYDAFMTKLGKQAAWKFLSNRKTFYVLDESSAIKTPGAKRTKSLIASGKYAKHKRILDGTPAVDSPFEIYSQLRFLDDQYWHKVGIGRTYAEFKRYFGVWRTRADVQATYGYDPGFDKLIAYKHVDELKSIITNISSRVTKDEALDLPPKLFTNRYVELTPKQDKHYQELKNEYAAELDSGHIVDAPLAIVRLLRLQQIACGYLPTDDEDEPYQAIDPERNPRLESLIELLDSLTHPAIIWARFSRDIDLICDRLGDRAVRYDGQVSDDERARSKNQFVRGDVQFFVGNPAAGATGLTLTPARTVVYYNNSFKLRERLQSEDRAHRIGQEHPVEYIDLVAVGTVDEHITKALRDKYEISTQLSGDSMRDWL